MTDFKFARRIPTFYFRAAQGVAEADNFSYYFNEIGVRTPAFPVDLSAEELSLLEKIPNTIHTRINAVKRTGEGLHVLSTLRTPNDSRFKRVEESVDEITGPHMPDDDFLSGRYYSRSFLCRNSYRHSFVDFEGNHTTTYLTTYGLFPKFSFERAFHKNVTSYYKENFRQLEKLAGNVHVSPGGIDYAQKSMETELVPLGHLPEQPYRFRQKLELILFAHSLGADALIEFQDVKRNYRTFYEGIPVKKVNK